ncbi:hypothetical protein NW759_012885 [Fusarium solani]|nr:hypothetical protein NW759_012885 [Fusarium solani]
METMIWHHYDWDGVYPRCARDWEVYDFYLSLPELQASLHELWDDWLSKQSPDYTFNPCLNHCIWVLYLVESEPLSWCYNRPNPNKETWNETAHLVRLLVRWQVVYRIMAQADDGLLDVESRIIFVRNTLAIVAVWAKLQLSGPAAIRHARGTLTPPSLR